MDENFYERKITVAWFPAGLISWYSPDGSPLVLVTSWLALVGGDNPRVRMAWYGRHDALSRFWSGGDFVLNVPHESCFGKIRTIMGQSKVCMDAEVDLAYRCSSGIAAVAPRLLECPIQIECVAGTLIETGFDEELSGDVARVHRDDVTIDPLDIPDLCAIEPFTV